MSYCVPICYKKSFKSITCIIHIDGIHVADPERNERVLITMQTAMRDPKVWGADADEFKLRELKKYENLSVAWLEPAVHSEHPEHNRTCPGKDLSIAMITGML